MEAFANSGLPDWKISLVLAYAFAALAVANVHSFREALADFRASGRSFSWRTPFAVLGRHELHYAKRIPLLMLFMATDVAVVSSL